MRRILYSISVWVSVSVMATSMAAARPAEAREVKATPQQKQQLKRLALETRRKSMVERDRIMRARTQLHQIYRKYDLAERKARTSLRQIGSAQRNLLNIHLDNQVRIRKILNEAQFRKFVEMTTKARGPEMAVMPPPGDAIMDRIPDTRMLESLGLSRTQMRNASTLQGPGPRKARVIDKLKQDSARMLQMYSQYRLDTASARRLVDSIHKSQVELSNLNLDRQRRMRSVLNKRQFNRLQQEIAKRLRAARKQPRR